MIRIVLTIPGSALRAGVRTLLEADSGLQVIRASPSPEALETADVWVVTDALSPEDIRQEVLTSQADVALLVLGEGRGMGAYPHLPVRAWGVLPVEATVEAMTTAIRALDAGLVVMYPDWVEFPFARRVSALAGEGEKLIEPLTDRETEVLQWLAQGLSNKQIAVRLHISEHTVKFHVSSVYGKLGATNRAEAVRLGAQQGLVVL
ncbi:MAG: response regulator transcription factor [Anaerolineales bacterium]